MEQIVGEWRSKVGQGKSREESSPPAFANGGAGTWGNEAGPYKGEQSNDEHLIRAAIPVVFVVCGPCAFSQATSAAESPCPMHAAHMGADAHHAMVESHGDQAMGFPHDKTTHHFRLAEDGGAIEVTANDPKDSANIEAIRTHLAHIAQVFSQGDFSTPMFVHDSIPPGVTTMKLLKEKIHFGYEPVGGRRARFGEPQRMRWRGLRFTTSFVFRSRTTGQAIRWRLLPHTERPDSLNAVR